ncbi:cytidylate kinase-like family protein [Patescibacteria group bacterium]|nr:cytidylate kinase-like family protein [Patescibacteria group bacterium]MBU1931907.1 cytidylate kinase-like family protein [Patescibacteria group bacterium]
MRIGIRDFLVIKQLDQWEKKVRWELEKPKKKPAKTIFRPIITVAREPGSGGKPMARLLAKKLGFKFYDKRLVNLIARSSRQKAKLVKVLDERAFNIIEGVLASFNKASYIPPTTFIKNLWRVVLTLSQKGKVVILGRGANFIAPPENTLRIRVIAPLRHRIKMAIKYEGHSLKKAEETIRHYHFERKDFIKRYFHKNISNANYYDLVINTRILTIKDGACIAEEAFKQKFTH